MNRIVIFTIVSTCEDGSGFTCKSSYYLPEIYSVSYRSFKKSISLCIKNRFQLVAELAMHQRSGATRKKVEQVLNSITPAQAGNWMDEMRSDEAYRYTAPWHFVNIELGSKLGSDAV